MKRDPGAPGAPGLQGKAMAGIITRIPLSHPFPHCAYVTASCRTIIL